MVANDTFLNLAMVGLLIVILIGAVMYLRPNILSEPFATTILDRAHMPRCFLRDMDAQRLLALVSEPKTAYTKATLGEFRLILEKILCIDADVTGLAMGVYTTPTLAYATAHDIEPASSLVMRCRRGAARNKEVDHAMAKFETRGNELLDVLCADPTKRREAQGLFNTILARYTQSIQRACTVPTAAMDRPAGLRDPGYHIPEKLIAYSEYKISGGKDQYI